MPEGDYDEYDKTSPMFLEFEEMLETGCAANKNKKKGGGGSGKLKREHIRMVLEKQSSSEMRRMQCYFGLRLSRHWDGPDLLEGAKIMAPLDLTAPVPCEFYNEPVFISIDVEWNERIPSQITEVGISTLDTLDLAGIAPGETGENWRAKIQSRHFRTREFQHVVNREFVRGCPENFEFGESEWVSVTELADTVDSCFYPPFSHGLRIGQRADAVLAIPIHKLRNRRAIFVGHGPDADLTYLQNMGTNIARDRSGDGGPTSGFLDVLDTSTLFRTYRGEANTRSLGNVLNAFDMTGWNLHNAGNDARYTMEVLIRIALKSRLIAKPGSGNVPMTNESVTNVIPSPTSPTAAARTPAAPVTASPSAARAPPVAAPAPPVTSMQSTTGPSENERREPEQVREERNVEMQEVSPRVEEDNVQMQETSGYAQEEIFQVQEEAGGPVEATHVGNGYSNGVANGNGVHALNGYVREANGEASKLPENVDMHVHHGENGNKREVNGHVELENGLKKGENGRMYDMNGYEYDEYGYSYDENGFAYDVNGYAYDENGYGYDENGNVIEGLRYKGPRKTRREQDGYVEADFAGNDAGYVDQEIGYSERELWYLEDEIDYERNMKRVPNHGAFVVDLNEID